MKFWIVLSSVLLVAAGFAAGFLVSGDGRLGVGSVPSERRGIFTNLFFQDNLQSFFTSDEVYRELELDAPQRQMIEYLLSSYSRSVKELKANMSELGTELRAGINAALTEAQRKRFEEVQKEWAERELEAHVSREAADLQRELSLGEELAAQVQAILLDAARERRDACIIAGKSRPSMEDWKTIRAKRDQRIENVLSAEQLEGYRKLKDRRRRVFHPEKGPPGGRLPGDGRRGDGPPRN
ncbi:MAG TPA: hypothetical protein VMT52_18125 [Planctomycetota bacterium]|nr:hypothetical protein [Planctomycetota bacterium]